METYFNIKVGSPDVKGSAVKAEPQAPDLADRLTLLDEDTSWELEPLREEGTESWYRFTAHDTQVVCGEGRDALGGRIGVPVPVRRGTDTFATLALTAAGELKVVEQTGKPLYITPMRKKEADDLVQAAGLWRLEQAYWME